MSLKMHKPLARSLKSLAFSLCADSGLLNCRLESLRRSMVFVQSANFSIESPTSRKEANSNSSSEKIGNPGESSGEELRQKPSPGKNRSSWQTLLKEHQALRKLKDAAGRLRANPVKEVTSNMQQGFDWLKSELSKDENQSSQRKRGGNFKKSDVTAVVATEKKGTSGWEKKWEEVKEKVEQSSAFQKLRQWTKPVVNKSQELAEDVMERWETSDSPVVHKIQDLNDSLFGENAQAAAMRVVRSRDPTFSLPGFISEVQASVRPILTAYNTGDLAFLGAKCRREVVERCSAERRALSVQGLSQSNRILHVSEVEVREIKMLQRDPIIIVGFRSQQTLCVTDRQGKVMEGGKDDILTVHHAWAMQLSSSEEESEETGFLPTWRLREMQQFGMQALI